jgi:hypothetical protein
MTDHAASDGCGPGVPGPHYYVRGLFQGCAAATGGLGACGEPLRV